MAQTAAFMQAAESRAVAMGLTWTQALKDIVDEFGATALDLAQELISQGFSVAFVTDVVLKLTPEVIDLIKKWTTQPSFAANFGAPSGALITWFIQTYGLKILKSLVPPDLGPVIDKYGPEIIAWILSQIAKQGGIAPAIP